MLSGVEATVHTHTHLSSAYDARTTDDRHPARRAHTAYTHLARTRSAHSTRTRISHMHGSARALSFGNPAAYARTYTVSEHPRHTQCTQHAHTVLPPPHTHAREHNTVSAHPRHMPHTAHALIHIAGLGGLFIHFSTDSHDWVARTERRRLHFPTCMLKHLRTWHARFSKHSSTS